jgi:hypothetical protein
MNRPIRVKCTSPGGVVLYVNLSEDWIWREQEINGKRCTIIFKGRFLGGVDAQGKPLIEPVSEAVRQTPQELKDLEREAIKDAMRQEMEIRRELAHELRAVKLGDA